MNVNMQEWMDGRKLQWGGVDRRVFKGCPCVAFSSDGWVYGCPSIERQIDDTVRGRQGLGFWLAKWHQWFRAAPGQVHDSGQLKEPSMKWDQIDLIKKKKKERKRKRGFVSLLKTHNWVTYNLLMECPLRFSILIQILNDTMSIKQQVDST